MAEDEDQLQKLLVAKDLFDDGDYDEFKEVIDEQSIPNYDELQVKNRFRSSLSQPLLDFNFVFFPHTETHPSDDQQN